jgi:hypothetical protein
VQYGVTVVDPSFQNTRAKLAPIDNPNRGTNFGKNMSVLYTPFPNRRMVYYTQNGTNASSSPEAFIGVDYTSYTSFDVHQFLFACFRATAGGALGDMVPCNVILYHTTFQPAQGTSSNGPAQTCSFGGSGAVLPGATPPFATCRPLPGNSTAPLFAILFTTEITGDNRPLGQNEVYVTAMDNFSYALYGGIACPYPVVTQFT